MRGVWREPSVETEDYPNLTVCDGRVTGSITVGHSRLPLWAIIHEAVERSWAGVEDNWPEITADYGFTQADLASFLYSLLEMRGEFGRLLCVLADVERRESDRRRRRPEAQPWWEHRASRKRVVEQLRICLAALDAAP